MTAPNRNLIERIVPYIMDGMYVLSLLLSLLGLRLVPFMVIPYLMVPAYIALFWTYRQVREYGFGSGGAPLLEQMGFNIPRFLHWTFIWIGFFVFFMFPFYLGILMVMSFDPSFGDTAHYPTALKLLTGFFMLGLAVFTWFCLASDRDEKKNMPDEKRKIYLRYVLPAAALFLGEGAASLADLIHSAWKDTGVDMIMAVIVFIPLRMVLMRAVGASKPVIFSFMVAAAFSVIAMMIK